jgi:hypothetical protein
MTEPLSDKQKKAIYARAYRAANRERLNQQWQAWAAAHPRSTKDKDAKYYAANRKKILEKKHEEYLSQRESPEFKVKLAEPGKPYRQKKPRVSEGLSSRKSRATETQGARALSA